ncbi:MAG: DUF2283 domain-containing protein [Candidatus Paceibacterales bacterium]
MSNKQPKIIYDKDARVLSWQLKAGKSVDSDIDDSVVIDYDKKGKIVRINFYNFSLQSLKKYKGDFKRLQNSVLQVV